MRLQDAARGVRAWTVCAVVALQVAAAGTAADEVRYYSGSDGKTYRETQQAVRTYQIPITEYRYETVLRGRWNPFVTPWYEQRLVPVVRYETRTELVDVPVIRNELVATEETYQVPVTRMRMVEEQQINRVVVNDAPAATETRQASAGGDPFAQPEATVARRVPIGGVQQYEGLPKQGAGWTGGAATTQRR